MRNAFKWIVITVGSVIGVVGIAVIAVFVLSQRHFDQSYDIQVASVPISQDSATLALGEHLVQIRGCTDCHGPDLAGKPFMEDPKIAMLYASNLTSGKGGVAPNYTDEDWVRSIRHGVRPDGKPLLFMPSQEFFFLSDEDLGAMISYIKTLPPVDRELPRSSVGPLGRVLFLTGKLPLVSAEMINHEAPRPEVPPPGITAEYGRYLALGCVGCHGLDLAGGRVPGAPPDWPMAANLTPAGNLKNWTEAEFIQTMRTGVKPNGEMFNAAMPWQNVAAMTDLELRAVWKFLKSLPPVEKGS